MGKIIDLKFLFVQNNTNIVTYMNWIYSIDEEFLLFLPKFLCWIRIWGIDIGSGESFRR